MSAASYADLIALGHGRGYVRNFIQSHCVADGFRPGSRGLPVSLWRVRERAA